MVKQIERDEVRALLASGAQLVDVLPEREYADEHLEGAISIPAPALGPDTVGAGRRDRRGVGDCGGRACDAAP
ncbi:MAG: hypothetical protein F4X25_09345, partial [Chloroflexi bacterium]|nr:hypothetical protein [Chloroflexota bacterium]